MRRKSIASAALLSAVLLAPAASADPYRLRADAYYFTPSPNPGLVVLDGEARAGSWVNAEAVLWVGSGDKPGDVLVAAVKARAPGGYADLRAGRMLVTSGAIRPVHLDGADVTARAPWGSSIEVFAGSPAPLPDAARDYTWALGGRAGQRIGQDASIGVSYLHMRDDGALAFEEVGLDAAAAITPWLDGALMGAFDVERLGLADARASLAARLGGLRFEAFAVHRSPFHLLPATSLFAALGDVPSQRAGGSIFWRAFPRLDVSGEAGAELLGGELGWHGMVRGLLRLDDKGEGALGVELRRQGAPGASFLGVRGTARVPIGRWVSASTELELARPDEARGRGELWPWGLVSLRFKPSSSFDVAGALEASASPEHVREMSGILRVSGALGAL